MKEAANCGGQKQSQMASRYLRIITISGAVIFLIGITAGFLRIEAETRHANLGSRPDWVDPPYTPFDTFILGFPASPFLTMGGALFQSRSFGRFSGNLRIEPPQSENRRERSRPTIAGMGTSFCNSNHLGPELGA